MQVQADTIPCCAPSHSRGNHQPLDICHDILATTHLQSSNIPCMAQKDHILKLGSLARRLLKRQLISIAHLDLESVIRV